VTSTTTTTTTTSTTPTAHHRPTPTGRRTKTADDKKKIRPLIFIFGSFLTARFYSTARATLDIVCRTCRGLVSTSQRDASAAADHHRNNTRCCIGYLCKSRLLPIKPPEGTSRSFDPRKINDECSRPAGRGNSRRSAVYPAERRCTQTAEQRQPFAGRLRTLQSAWVSNTAAKLLNNLVSRGCHLGWFWGVHGLPSIGLDHPPEGAKPQVGWRRLDLIQHT
jgi:hypothetical protein